MIYGYNEDGLVMLLGRMVIANNRLTEEIQIRDAKIAELEKRLAEVTQATSVEEEQTNG